MINFIIRNYRLVGFAMLVGLVVWLYKSREAAISESKIQTENAAQLRKIDSTHYASQILSQREINDYLEYDRKDLKLLLEQSDIRQNRIESILSNQYRYSDNSQRGYDATGIVTAVRENKDLTVPFKDTTKCMTIEGNISYKNDSLKVIITSRKFQNTSDAVAYWERRQWKFLGIKTRFLGKKIFTAKTFDQCGESHVMKIEKKQ